MVYDFLRSFIGCEGERVFGDEIVFFCFFVCDWFFFEFDSVVF